MTDEPSDDSVEVHVHGEQLNLELGPREFSQVIAALSAIVPEKQRTVITEKSFQLIFIARRLPPRPPASWREKIMGFGCFLAALIVVFVFLVGIMTIFQVCSGNWRPS